MIKILFFAANPYDSGALQLPKEFRKITEAIQLSPFGHLFEVKANWATKPSDLQQLFFEYEPHIVHYTGHSDSLGQLVLQDENDWSALVPVQAFADLIKMCKGIKLVSLSSCFSLEQADDIAGHVDYVIGNSTSITDEAAIIFGETFYKQLAHGKSVGDSYKIAKNNVALQQTWFNHNDIKLLIKKDVSPDLPLVSEELETKKQFKEYFSHNGFRVGIEFIVGDIRFTNPLTCSYGSFLDLKGLDGDLLDVLIGDHHSKRMYRIDQFNHEGGLDEYKIAIKFSSREEAEEAYKNNWPKELFSKIQPITSTELHLWKIGAKASDLAFTFEEIQEEIGKQTDTSVTSGLVLTYETSTGEKRAKVTRSRIAPEEGKKYSDNDVFYSEETVDYFIQYVQETLSNGIPIICRLDHPEKTQHANELPAISLLKWVWKHTDGSILCEDLHCFTNPEAIEWSKRLASGEELARSWETKSYCQTSYAGKICYPLHLYTVCWVPDGKQPGFNNSTVIEVVELQETNRNFINQVCDGACPNTCKCKLNKSPLGEKEKVMPENQNPQTRRRAVLADNVISALVNVSMDWASLKVAISEAGGDEEDIQKASMMFLEAGDVDAPEEPLMADDGDPQEFGSEDNPEEQMFTMFETFVNRLKLKKTAKKESNSPNAQIAKARKMKYRSGILANPLEVQRLNKILEREATLERRQEVIEKFGQYVEKAIKGEKRIIVYKVINNKEANIEHDLTNHKKYPIEEVLSLKKETISKIDQEGVDYNYAVSYFNGRLDAIQMNALLMNNRMPEIQAQVEVPNDLAGLRAKMDESADRAVVRKFGQSALDRNYDTKKRISQMLKPIVESREKIVSPVMARALYVQEQIARKKMSKYEPDYELLGLMIEAGLLTQETALLNTGSQLVTQCHLSDMVWRRVFETADFLEIVAPLMSSELDPKVIGQNGDVYSTLFTQAGTEVRYLLHQLLEPRGDGELFLQSPGESKVVTVQSQLDYDSVAIDEQAVRYIWAKFFVDALRNNQNIDIESEVSIMIADLMKRRLSKRAFRFADNIARQYGAKKVTTEISTEANLYLDNEVNVDGYVTVYDSSITAIYKLEMEQGVQGNDIESLLLVHPEGDKWQDRNGKQTATYYDFKFEMEDETEVRIGELYFDPQTGTFKTEDAYPGQNHNCAVNWNDCVVVEVNGGLNMAADNLPQFEEYWYVMPITMPGGNLRIYNMIPDEGVDIKDHIDNLLDAFVTDANTDSQRRNAKGNVIFSSNSLKGHILRARRFSNNFHRDDTQYHGTNKNRYATVGDDLDLWSSDSRMLGGENVFVRTRYGRTRCLVSTALETTDLGFVDVNGSANTVTDKTTSTSRMWRSTFGIKNPGVFVDRANAPRKFYNEPAAIGKVRGLSVI